MIYLDASATTLVKKSVMDEFMKVSTIAFANPNSLHHAGLNAKTIIDDATNNIANNLNILPSEIIYTSGASESNNLAIKGIALKNNAGKHIITTRFEHPSVIGPLGWLQDQGFEIDFVNTDQAGQVDLNHLRELLRSDTILVTIASVNSELGISQPIDKIGTILKDYPHLLFHVDLTQSIGKEALNLKQVDLASISAHKFGGIKGIGTLIKKQGVELEPLIHGGGSTTIYRSGTPAPALIASLSIALTEATKDLDEQITHVAEGNQYLRIKLSGYKQVTINSPANAVPHILNFSIVGVDPKQFQALLSEHEVYISVGTACNTGYEVSPSVLALTGSEAIASSSMRISLTSDITKEQLNKFLKIFEVCYNELVKE